MKAQLARLAASLLPAIAALGVLWLTNSLRWFALALAVALFGGGALGDRLWRRWSTPEQQRADLEERVRAWPD